MLVNTAVSAAHKLATDISQMTNFMNFSGCEKRDSGKNSSRSQCRLEELGGYYKRDKRRYLEVNTQCTAFESIDLDMVFQKAAQSSIG